jgi:cytochrome oxidase Cu insertion factor (SCO1/SenC/PrrC family)
MMFSNHVIRCAIGGGVLSLAAASIAMAQAPAAPSVPAVGSMAPDFTLPGATRYGRLSEPVRLSDFRGKTVVIAFFYQARTKG